MLELVRYPKMQLPMAAGAEAIELSVAKVLNSERTNGSLEHLQIFLCIQYHTHKSRRLPL